MHKMNTLSSENRVIPTRINNAKMAVWEVNRVIALQTSRSLFKIFYPFLTSGSIFLNISFLICEMGLSYGLETLHVKWQHHVWDCPGDLIIPSYYFFSWAEEFEIGQWMRYFRCSYKRCEGHCTHTVHETTLIKCGRFTSVMHSADWTLSMHQAWSSL